MNGLRLRRLMAVSIVRSSTTSNVSSSTVDALPGPKPMPLLGNMNLFKPFGHYDLERVNDAAGDLAKRYGPIVRLRLGLDIVFLFDPDDVATVFRSEAEHPERPAFEALVRHRRQRPEQYLHLGLFTENGAGWAHLRSLVNPLLHPQCRDAYLDDQCRVAAEFMEHLDVVRDSSGRVRDVLRQIYKYTQEAAGLVSFGTRLGCFDRGRRSCVLDNSVDVNASVMDMLDAMARTLLTPPLWKLFPTPTYRKLVKSQDNLYTVSRRMVDAARQRLACDPVAETRRSPFLTSLLVRARDSSLDDRDVVLVVMELFQAGIDSTASTIAMTLYHLATNPQVQQQVVDEIDANLGPGEQITCQLLPRFRLVNACIKETMRVSCPVGGSARIIGRDLVLSGYDVPANTLVIGNHPVMSVSEAFVSQAHVYDPHRWMRREPNSNSHQQTIRPFVSLPFSFGSRACPGRRIAQQEIAVFLIEFFRKFHCTYCDSGAGAVRMIMRLNYVPDRPLHFTLHHRSQYDSK